SYRDLLSPPAASGSGQSGAWSGFRPLRVTRTQAETDVVLSIYLAVEGNEPLPGPAPGQYLTVRVPVPGVPAAVRSYSISGAPGGGYRISVKRETPGSVSSYLHSTITAGSTLDVAAPRGEFVLRDDDSPVLLLSAGIGATPVLAMLAHLAEARSRRDVWWIHTARDRAHHVFAEESRALIAALPNGHLHTFLTGEPTGAQADDTVTAGRPDAAALTALGISPMSSAYLCGPTGFLADVQAALTAAGVAPQSIYSELFGARSPVNPGLVDVARPAPHHPPGAPGDGPLVTFARSGLSVAWPARQHSLLDLADSCDVPTRWSCRTGVCHTCSTGLLSGQTTYVTEPLEPPPDGEVLICCAAPSSDVVIDL
ncbi:MAG: phthalate 4,5-dioxygenase, partial [Mycobacterium sp.]|nr:phthalate 4,5-dioxygenase [Mycobacterium sp.]